MVVLATTTMVIMVAREHEELETDTHAVIHPNTVGHMVDVRIQAPNAMPKKKDTKIMLHSIIRWEVVHHSVELVIPDGVGLMTIIVVIGYKLK